MKRLLITFFGMLIFIPAFSQAETEQKLDTIYMLGQTKKVVNIKRVIYSKIIYEEPGSDESKEIDKKQVQRIVYHSGRREKFNDPIIMDVDETSWQNVVLTNEKSEVKGLYEVGEVHGESSSRNRTPKAAERTAKIRLKRRAANKGAQIVLITKDESSGGFGEIPKYSLKGIAYSFTKPEEENKEKEE
ncbi:MAG: hypothetical protein ACQESJ_02025 [Bacteroidota bacterium]